MSRMQWDLDDGDAAVTLFTEIRKLQGEIGKQFVRILSTDIAVNIQHPTSLFLMWDAEYDKYLPPDCGRKVIYCMYSTCENHKHYRGGASISVGERCQERQLGFRHIKCFTTSAHIARNFRQFYPDLNREFTFVTIVALKRTSVQLVGLGKRHDENCTQHGFALRMDVTFTFCQTTLEKSDGLRLDSAIEAMGAFLLGNLRDTYFIRPMVPTGLPNLAEITEKRKAFVGMMFQEISYRNGQHVD